MPPKTDTKPSETETLSLLIAACLKKDPKFTIDYKLMSALTFGERSHGSFEWEFRAIKKRAKDIIDEAERREAGWEVLQVVKYSKGQSPGLKRAHSKTEDAAADDNEQDGATDTGKKKPAKPRAKRAKKSNGAVNSPDLGDAAEDGAMKEEDGGSET